ncbi:uncharacterized protein DNG_02863 [Cephalotrichum gorgonifer]|uniref:Uncharacterized protein n=1 Tax=Cephalotrichum gorgonifer TaxID=2041049 RepID=A0AAE8ST13_9PEZI|nr:uncharacterized protein DNG_02863 [Cephalotrichum gorgonifer]
MPLVPLHIRGKKGKKRSAAQISSTASASSTPASSSSSPGNEVTRSRKKPHGSGPGSSRRLSILERLPVEVLVLVFTESQNVNLMYCNRHIHLALDNKYSLVRLVTRAFAPTWLKHFGSPRSREVEAPDVPPIYGAGRRDIARLQENLLAKKFFTIDLALSAQQLWFDEFRPSKSGRIHCLPNCKCSCCAGNGAAEDAIFNASQSFERDFQLAKDSVSRGVEGWSGFRSRQDVEVGIKLNPKRLHGPWDEDTEKLIFWLVTGGIFVDHQNWDPQVCINIVLSHANAARDINPFFAYNARALVSFTHWPLYEAYPFYLRNKPDPPGSKWDPVRLKFNEYLHGTFDGHDSRDIRRMRRDAGRDVDDSDAPYDPDNDYWDSDDDAGYAY